MNDQLKGHLASLESLKSSDSSENIYDAWAKNYDRNLSEEYDYVAPQIAITAFLAQKVSRSAHIVDYGCGTGLVGKLLWENGFNNVDGYDISQGMLDIAAEKGVYNGLYKADLTKNLEIDTETYDAMICVGSFAAGHLNANHLDEMLRTIKKGGAIVLFMNEQFYLKDNYPSYFVKLMQAGVWTLFRQERHNYMQSIHRPGWLVIAER